LALGVEMTAEPSVEALAATVRAGIAPAPYISTDEMFALERDALAALDSLTERLEQAERENVDVEVDRRYQQDRARAAEARAQKAEAALREISEVGLPTGNAAGRDELKGCHQARIAMQTIARRALVDEPPTGEGGVT
jgi:hypothetical protein